MQLVNRFGPSVLSMGEKAQANLARMAGLQTPAAQQASSRLMEPATAERAMSAIRASGPGGTNPLITAGGTAATALAMQGAGGPAASPPASPDTAALFSQLNRDPDSMARMRAVERAREVINMPEYEGARAPMYMDKESYGLPDSVYRQLDNLATSAGKSDAEYRRAPVTSPRAATQAAAAAEPEKKGFFSSLLGGPQYQSTGQALVERPQGPTREGAPQKTVLNWGDPDNSRDFFRADQAMREMMKNKEEFEGRASGGKVGAGAGGKDAAIHKALEIIHHLLTRR